MWNTECVRDTVGCMGLNCSFLKEPSSLCIVLKASMFFFDHDFAGFGSWKDKMYLYNILVTSLISCSDHLLTGKIRIKAILLQCQGLREYTNAKDKLVPAVFSVPST